MRFDILTIFPEAYESFIRTSLIGKAVEAGVIEINVFDVREFSADKHKKVDDVPYGGGAGMVMLCQPLFAAIKHVKSLVDDNAPVIYLTPQGERLNQGIVESLCHPECNEGSSPSRVILLSGHYEGIDQRVRDALVDREISIGDYVLNNGDLPCMVLVEAIARLIPGVIGKEESHQEESFSEKLDGMLEYPHYTRPEEYEGMKVPNVLLSGHHAKIEAWRKSQCKKPKD